MSNKFVYVFGPSRTDGAADMKNILGGKGANLAEMCRLGISVPPGLTISAESCTIYTEQGAEAVRKLKASMVIDGKLKAPSGFAIGPDGDFYVAERLKQRVQRFSAKGKKKETFIGGLPDMPEFLVHVPDRV